MDKTRESVNLAICVATYRRPVGLQRLLISLRMLRFVKSPPPNLRIIIVDNDISTSNKDLINDLIKDLLIPVIYEVERERGIASARNHAVRLAGDVDFIAFIDDDEVADPLWIDELLSAQKKFGADVVNGPVIPRFEQPAPAWVLKGHFYDRRRFSTGTEIKWANTGNVLIKTKWLQAVRGPFNVNLNLTGGEDSLFFSQVFRMGAKMVWANEAIVEEFNPPSRVSANWILRRSFRGGVGTSVTEMMLDSALSVIIIRVFKSFLHILLGFLLLFPASIFHGYAGLIRSLMYASLGAGEIGGIFGINYMEYKDIHGN
jgi:succinoglycan biosynthesis protein ExoM